MAYGDFKDLNGTAADKVLHDKVFAIAVNPKFDGYQRGLASKKLLAVVIKIQIFQIKN